VDRRSVRKSCPSLNFWVIDPWVRTPKNVALCNLSHPWTRAQVVCSVHLTVHIEDQWYSSQQITCICQSACTVKYTEHQFAAQYIWQYIVTTNDMGRYPYCSPSPYIFMHLQSFSIQAIVLPAMRTNGMIAAIHICVCHAHTYGEDLRYEYLPISLVLTLYSHIYWAPICCSAYVTVYSEDQRYGSISIPSVLTIYIDTLAAI